VLERELSRSPASLEQKAAFPAVSIAAATATNELRGAGAALSPLDEEEQDAELAASPGGLSLVRLKAWLQGPIDR
jgi:hypothetical protein